MKAHTSIVLFILCIYNLLAQNNISLYSHLNFSQKINDIWGYEDSLGNEYALVGSEIGFHIVDISNASPTVLFDIPGQVGVWRDVKVYNHFAYVVNEQGGGLLIVDLNQLPLSAPYQYITQIDTFNYQTAHNIFIDENGVAYLSGSNIGNKGVFMLNLATSNPYQPEYLGKYDAFYVHDAYARGDTLYTAEISNGTFSIVDVHNKQFPIVLAQQETSFRFTHNCWLSDDGKYLITTDEKPGAFVDLYDISNLNNIKRLDKYQSSPGNNVIPHNTFFKGNYIFTSYYHDGLTLVDATVKNNLVEVGNYDTSPFLSNDGFEGNWGVYPYFSSGKVIATDREEGLFVFTVDYKRACYLSGNVFDTLQNQPVSDAQIELIGTNYMKYSAFNGDFFIGALDSAYYDLRVSKPGCQTRIETHILLEPGIEKTMQINTQCMATKLPTDATNLDENWWVHASKNKITVVYNAMNIVQTVRLINVQGQVIKEIVLNDSNFILEFNEKLAEGIYFIQLQSNDFQSVKEVIGY